MEKSLRVLNLIDAGGIGGIETLCLNAAGYTSNDNTYLFLWKSGKISDEMISRGYKVEVLNTSIQKYMKDSLKVAKICRARKYDVVICHGINPMVALCTIWIRLLCKNTRIISYVHNNPVGWRMRYVMSAYIIFWCSQKVICISDSVLSSVKRRIGYGNKLIRIYNGVDLSKFQRKIEKNVKTGNHLIYVGRLAEKKGIDVILNALTKVSAEYHLDIVGDGACRMQFEDMSIKLGINKKVTFHGNQSDVQRFLSGADIFIHVPTLEEGFGITVVEALAAGLLCICSKSGALPEIITDGVNGYLVEKNDPEELADVIQTLIEYYDSEENRKIRNNAVTKAKEYSINTYSAAVDKLTNEISCGGGVKLIYVGRLEKVKGVQNILWELAKVRDVDYTFEVVGDGSYRRELESITNEFELDDKVKFLGTQRDIPELLWRSDVFVHLPEWQEGFGITVIEAMAAGKICIVNDHGALPEIITDGVNGYIIRKGIRNFKETIEEIYLCLNEKSKSSKTRELQEGAVKRAKDFSIETYSHYIDKVIKETACR